MKWFPAANQRVNLAAFTATTDQEIVIDTATGGRTTYRNASKTRRRGFEAAWDADLGQRHRRARQLHVPACRIRGTLRFRHSSRRHARRIAAAGRAAATGVRHARMDAGRLRRIQRRRRSPVRRAHLRQRREHAPMPRRTRSATSAWASRSRWIACSFPNTSASTTSPTSITSARSSSGDTNGRYYEPAPGRNWYAGVSISAAF